VDARARLWGRLVVVLRLPDGHAGLLGVAPVGIIDLIARLSRLGSPPASSARAWA
jgi:hypothetical protein